MIELSPFGFPTCLLQICCICERVKINKLYPLKLHHSIFSVNYLNYGPFSSHAPVYDTSFSNTSKEESDLLLSTYGDESGLQYAKRQEHSFTEVLIRRSIQLFPPQYCSYPLTKPYDVGTQKNRLIETILLSTHIIGLEVK